MFAAAVLLFVRSMPGAEVLVARDLSPFASLDAAVRDLPVSSTRSYASVAKGLAAVAKTPLERSRAAYVWTTEHIAYSLDKHRDATAALADLTGDCDAHAAVYASLCKALGVECVTIAGRVRFAVPPGTGLSGYSKPLAEGQWLVAHAWNAVRIDGGWGLVDATMGGGSSPKNGTNAPADDYFLPDPAVVATDHVPNDVQWNLTTAPTDLARTPVLRPLSWRMGMSPDTLSADARRDAAQIVLRPKLPWRKGLRASLQTESASLPDRVLLQPTPDGVELRLCPPGPPSLVWLGLNVEGVWRPLAGYPVTGPVAGRLPKVMTRFYDSGASLAGPYEKVIAAGKPAEIRLRAPGAEQVVAFQGDDLAGRFVREGEFWVLRTAPLKGLLEVMASYEDPGKFQGLLTYEVR
ncbi:hypothetical protein EON82_14165 [bacterium]|nr:MAG: hypothetical protein EON82_14165 [bacterium]